LPAGNGYRKMGLLPIQYDSMTMTWFGKEAT
jgi:hypothetical protein